MRVFGKLEIIDDLWTCLKFSEWLVFHFLFNFGRECFQIMHQMVLAQIQTANILVHDLKKYTFLKQFRLMNVSKCPLLKMKHTYLRLLEEITVMLMAYRQICGSSVLLYMYILISWLPEWLYNMHCILHCGSQAHFSVGRVGISLLRWYSVTSHRSKTSVHRSNYVLTRIRSIYITICKMERLFLSKDTY